MAQESRVYSLDEVSAHRTASDLWVASRGKVYDVTTFAARHPGGAEVLVGHGGEDVTELMQALEPHRHSKAAYAMLDQYCIGELAGAKYDAASTSESRHRSEQVGKLIRDLI